MGENDISIGNVRFNKNDVKSKSVSIDKDGDNIYSVFLKNGTSISFRKQDKDANASVTVGYDMGNNNKYGTAFSGIVGLSIQGSDKDDYYHLSNCDYYDIDVKGGGNDEVRVFNPMYEPDYANITKDAGDNVKTINGKDGFSMSEGFFVEKPFDDNPVAPPKPVKNRSNTNTNNTVKTLKDNLSDLRPITSFVSDQDNAVREYRDADGNTVIRVDYLNDDPEEFFAEEEVRSPEGRLISYTSRFSDGNGPNGYVGFDKYVYDEIGNLSKVITTTYEKGKLISTKEAPPTPEQETKLVGIVYPGHVIPDTQMRDFLESRGATMVGHY